MNKIFWERSEENGYKRKNDPHFKRTSEKTENRQQG